MATTLSRRQLLSGAAQAAARHTPAAPLILEDVGPADYRAALDHLRAALQQAGLAAI